jgi:hypothetical protein
MQKIRDLLVLQNPGISEPGKSPNFEGSEGTEKQPSFKVGHVKKTYSGQSSAKESHKFAP